MRPLAPLARLAAAAALLLAAPAAASGPFMIHFDSGSARLDPVGEAQLDAAAGWLRSNGLLQLRLSASSDRVGSAASNRRLARRRGEAVRAALVRRGFPPSAIELVVHGEARPLVETEDGVAEPQNRSVMIEFFPAAPTPPTR